MRIPRAGILVSCLMLGVLPFAAHADLTAQKRAELQMQLDQVETDILRNQTNLAQKQKERASLERDVSILDGQIKAAQLGIKARDITIEQLQGGIADKTRGIRVLDAKVVAGRASIAQMIRHTRIIDDISLAEVALAGTLSDVMREVDAFETVERALGDSFDEIAMTRSDLAARKQALEDQRQEEQDMLQLQTLERNVLKRREQDKKNLVAATRGQEAVYLQVIAGKKQTAAQIRAALFELRDTKAISFGAMAGYAKEASAKTGVRAAVILGILAEESNLGQNVGTGNWKTDMHPTRDAPIFQQICSVLGLNPDAQPVSKKAWYGWGGAMGPAQFIPSTWRQYQDRIARVTGQDPANPWDPRTAAFAAAMLMADNGADAGTPEAERLAALRYLAGWKNATKKAYAFYGNDVMDLAAKFQGQLDILGG